MNHRRLLLPLLFLGLVLLSCNWTAPLQSVLKPTPTAVVVPTATPTKALPPVSLETGEGGVIAEEALLTSLYEQVSPSVVYIQVPAGEGSGFVWDKEGHIVTNNHVVQGARSVLVQFFDGNILEAEIVGLDPQSDIAVIRVEPSDAQLLPVVIGDSDEVKVGQLAIAIGNPFGQNWTMTRGIVSALDRSIRSGSTRFRTPEVIQTDAAINPGNSGGPLLDSSGRVIGMNTMILSGSGTSAGVGFAVPIDIVKLVVPELIATGRYVYPWLGITGRRLLPQDVEAMDLPVRQGALVTDVEPGGPADEAELRGSDRFIQVDGERIDTGGDVIVAVEGEPVRDMDDLIAYLVLHTRPGQTVMLKVIRDGNEMSVPVTLGQRPE